MKGERIPRFKRIQQFIPEDYDRLLQILENFQNIVATPNILTEVNSLAGEIRFVQTTDNRYQSILS